MTEHSRKALLSGNILLIIPQEFIDNKDKDTKYIWIGLDTEDMEKTVEDHRVKEKRWWLLGEDIFGESKVQYPCL